MAALSAEHAKQEPSEDFGKCVKQFSHSLQLFLERTFHSARRCQAEHVTDSMKKATTKFVFVILNFYCCFGELKRFISFSQTKKQAMLEDFQCSDKKEFFMFQGTKRRIRQ